MRSWSDVWGAFLRQLKKEPRVAWLGVLGVGLGALCAGVGLLAGFQVPPEGSLWETATFNGAVGIYLLTLAALAPETGISAKGQRRWAWALVPPTVYSYGIETVQAFRGLDPRFSAVAGPLDQALGGLFLLAALVIMVLFLVLAWKFFTAETTPLRIGVRYASVAALISFGVGIFMSIQNGRVIGAEGNLLLIHGAGFHGLQAVPLVALFLAWGRVDQERARAWVHLAGVAWVGLCAAVLGQAVAGIAPTALTQSTVAAVVLFGGWAATAVVSIRAWRRPSTAPA
ncbi:MAG: hypothetical protein ACOC8K_00180 [Gemmatimonadota bacterium]